MTGMNGPVTKAFDFKQWRTLTEEAIAEGERQIADAEQAVKDATAMIARRKGEVKLLRKALGIVAPAPPASPAARSSPTEPSARDRAAAQLLEAARRAGPGVLSWGEARAMAGDRSGSTVSAALQLLVDRGDVVKDGPGKYRLASSA